jgi:hypothetical protein
MVSFFMNVRYDVIMLLPNKVEKDADSDTQTFFSEI